MESVSGVPGRSPAGDRQPCNPVSRRLQGRVGLVIGVGSALTRETAATFAREES